MDYEGKYFTDTLLSYLAKGSGEYARHCRKGFLGMKQGRAEDKIDFRFEILK